MGTGGWANHMPSFLAHPRHPGAEARSANGTDKSWCAATNQLVASVFSK